MESARRACSLTRGRSGWLRAVRTTACQSPLSSPPGSVVRQHCLRRANSRPGDRVRPAGLARHDAKLESPLRATAPRLPASSAARRPPLVPRASRHGKRPAHRGPGELSVVSARMWSEQLPMISRWDRRDGCGAGPSVSRQPDAKLPDVVSARIRSQQHTVNPSRSRRDRPHPQEKCPRCPRTRRQCCSS
jgi:hypothetical protein